jgi:hypothetical protein
VRTLAFRAKHSGDAENVQDARGKLPQMFARFEMNRGAPAPRLAPI